jgi:hypothetical protein
LHRHKAEIQLFLDQNAIDVLLVSETHFTDKSYFNTPRYHTYQTNHPDGTAHGGTAILIKQTINHYELPKYETQHIQATSVKVKALPYEITVSAVYCPPRHNLKREHFEPFFETLGPKFIAGGDYNSKHTTWGSRLVTTKGSELLQTIRNKHYTFLSTGSPTYWPTDAQKLPDVLDFFITHGISTAYTAITPSYDLTSDHSPIIATVSTTVIYRNASPRLHSPKTNWDTYREILQERTNLSAKLQDDTDIDRETSNLIHLLQQAAKDSTPNYCQHGSPLNIHNKINIPIEIKKLVAVKRRARSRWHRTQAPTDKNKYNQLSNKLKHTLKALKNAEFENYTRGLTRQDNSIWKPIKNKRKPMTAVPPIRQYSTPPGPWARSNQEKAELFAKHLTQTYSPHSDESDDDIEQELSLPEVVEEQLRPLKLHEMKYEIKMLNPKKAPGLDLITAKMLKELPEKTIRALLYLFNAILRVGYWPSQLKTGQVITILKPGKDPTNAESYRPISLLPTISKLLEKLVHKRLQEDLDPKEWVPDHQFGFRHAHSTVQQCHRIVDVINKAIENRQYCTAAFLDVTKAFDRVWHKGLLVKIKRTLPPSYFKLMKAYLHQRECEVKVADAVSKRFPIHTGVPQGSVLGPLLYILYTLDLPVSRELTVGTFADDTAIMAVHANPVSASRNLQDYLIDLGAWLRQWKITVNETKSCHVTFTLRKGNCPAVQLNQTPIPQTTSVRYLGMHLDTKLTWQHHIQTKRKQLNLKIKEINWLIGRKSHLSLDNKLLIYKTVIKPVWMYGCELWGCASKSNIHIIQRFQSKLLRTIADAPWFVTNHTLHTDFKIPKVRDVIHERLCYHRRRLEAHTNPLLEPLLIVNNNRRLKRLWPTDMY